MLKFEILFPVFYFFYFQHASAVPDHAIHSFIHLFVRSIRQTFSKCLLSKNFRILSYLKNKKRREEKKLDGNIS